MGEPTQKQLTEAKKSWGEYIVKLEVELNKANQTIREIEGAIYFSKIQIREINTKLEKQ